MTGRRLIAIVGTTATGKTALAVELARRLGGAPTGGRPAEIVGADSRQVYRHMDIGTAKPTPAERAAAPHHLIDIVDPDQPFSLAQWLELAQAALDAIWSSGRQPLLVGGTGQYVWALLEGWRVPRVPPDRELRRSVESRAQAIVDELRQADPESVERLDLRNLRRVVRALEVYHATGKPLSYWRTKEPPDFETLIIGLRLPRDELYRRIDRRVETMIEGGLIEETRRLLAMGYARDLPSMSGIGYKEACAHLAGDLTLEEATTRVKTETHRLARHQNAWFKPSDTRIRWLDAEGALEEAAGLAREFAARRAPA